MTHDATLVVQNLQRDFAGVAAEVIVDDGAIGWIVRLRFLRRQWRSQEASLSTRTAIGGVYRYGLVALTSAAWRSGAMSSRIQNERPWVATTRSLP